MNTQIHLTFGKFAERNFLQNMMNTYQVRHELPYKQTVVLYS